MIFWGHSLKKGKISAFKWHKDILSLAFPVPSRNIQFLKAMVLILIIAILQWWDSLLPGYAQTIDSTFNGEVIVQINGRRPFGKEKDFEFNLALKGGTVREAKDGGKFKFPTAEEYKRSREEHSGQLIKKLEERLNRSNVTSLQHLADMEYNYDLEIYQLSKQLLPKYEVPIDTTRYRDIISRQDGAVVKHLNPKSLFANHQFSYALHHLGLYYKHLVDLETLAVYPLPFPEETTCRGYGNLTWSPNGKSFVLYEKGFLLMTDLPSRKILFQKRLENNIQHVAWSLDSKSIAILNSSYRIGVAPHELLFAFAGHPVPHNNFYLELIKINSGESMQFLIVKNIIYGRGRVHWKE